jgi:hypothetical protein
MSRIWGTLHFVGFFILTNMNSHSYNIDMEKILDSVKLTKMEKILKVASDLTRLKILFSLFDEHHCHDNSMDCGLCKCKLCLSEKKR